MSIHQTARTQYVSVNNIEVAYRLFGTPSRVPLLFNQHFRGTMDHWDPLLINTIATTRQVLLFDSYGVGKSSGDVPETFAGWADVAASLLSALSIEVIDVFGFSMGSMAAQMLALNYPSLVRRLVLGGASPSYGRGVVTGPAWTFPKLMDASTPEEYKNAYLSTFYDQVPKKQRLAEEWWARIQERSEDRSPYLGPEQTSRQASAAQKWFSAGNEASGSYDRLGELKMPVLVVNGDEDITVPTENSLVLYKKIKEGNRNCHLHIYPGTGHGFLNEYAEMFGKHLEIFLDMERVI
ncbi:hypothetical protein ACEPPN_018137 [Leptodophora sp. 'Broadleaf-Isolate-01']